MLSAEALKEIDRAVAKYPPDQKRSAVMASLAVAQDELGWASPEAMQFVADYLGMPAIAVQEIATFYNMFDTRPPGKYKITICTNLPCQLRDADRAADYIKEKLGIDFNETTADGRFTLKEGECMGSCGDAPVLLLNNKTMCSFMSRDKIDALIAELQDPANDHRRVPASTSDVVDAQYQASSTVTSGASAASSSVTPAASSNQELSK